MAAQPGFILTVRMGTCFLSRQGKSFEVNIEGSCPQHSFRHVGGDSILYVFEAPADRLSLLTLYPEGTAMAVGQSV